MFSEATCDEGVVVGCGCDMVAADDSSELWKSEERSATGTSPKLSLTNEEFWIRHIQDVSPLSFEGMLLSPSHVLTFVHFKNSSAIKLSKNIVLLENYQSLLR